MISRVNDDRIDLIQKGITTSEITFYSILLQQFDRIDLIQKGITTSLAYAFCLCSLYDRIDLIQKGITTWAGVSVRILGRNGDRIDLIQKGITTCNKHIVKNGFSKLIE